MKNIVALPLLALLTMSLFLHSSCYGQTGSTDVITRTCKFLAEVNATPLTVPELMPVEIEEEEEEEPELESG